MWQFIISGYVPGTDLQITFDIIATFGAAFVLCLMLWITIKRQLAIRRDINQIMSKFDQIHKISL